MSTATSSVRAGRRQSRPSTASTADEPLALPPYQRQTYKLNTEAKLAIHTLAQSEHFRHLDVHVRNLAAALTGVAGEVNDQLTDARKRTNARKRKRAQEENSEDATNNADRSAEVIATDREHIEDLEARVDATTKQVEEEIREVVDAEIRIGAMKTILEKIGKTNNEGKGGSRKRRTRKKGVEDDEDEDGDGADDDYDPDREDNADTQDVVPAGEVFETQLQEKQTEWESRTLTQRYSTHNTYIGFYRILHESKHAGDDPPPLPRPSTWFEHLESSTTNDETSHPRTRGARKSGNVNPDTDEDSDNEEVAVARERFSTRCPITLLNFQDPVTSTKCPHTFERAAIEDMIRRSRDTDSPTGQNKLKYVKCPVCSLPLTMDDLKTDPTVLRRVKRMIAEEKEREQAEGDDGEDEDEEMQDVDQEVVVTRKSQLGSKVKMEKVELPERERSMVPGTQFDSILDADDMTQ